MSDILIESVLQERRQFPPPDAFRGRAHISSLEQYQRLCQEFQRHPQEFWAGWAERELHWFRPWEQVLDWQPPHA
ncbi:MAG: acetyl-coenzyme A synthetase N-terminal domain-containing protein, partial [Gloeomargarita sp. DG02_4_bins_56]